MSELPHDVYSDLVDGVMDLFPGVDRQALRCLAELMVKRCEARLAKAREALEAVDAEVVLTGALKDIVDAALADSEPSGRDAQEN